MTTNANSIDNPRAALTGVKVLDLTHFLSGPFATMILGDLGAEVIKVEPPHGDPMRKIPPFQHGETSTFFFSVNRNKKSVVLNLKSDEGREAFLSLVEQSDIVIHNFRPGVLERLGIDYPDLLKRKADIILCSVYGFERDGPLADAPAVDTLVQALSGVMSLTGERDGPPARVGYQIGDTSAGLWAVIAMLSALHGRTLDGLGRHVEVALFDSQLSLLVWQAQDYLTHGTVYTRMGTRHATLPPSQTFECSDARHVYATPSAIPHWWRAYCVAVDEEWMADDPRFADLSGRQQNRDILEEIIASKFIQHPSAYWLERFRQNDVPAALVQTVDEAFAFPTVARRNMIVEVAGADGAKARMVGNPIKSGAPERFTFPPELGEHTDEVLARARQLKAAEA